MTCLAIARRRAGQVAITLLGACVGISTGGEIPQVVISDPIDTGGRVRETVIQASPVNPCHLLVAWNSGGLAWATDGADHGRDSFTLVEPQTGDLRNDSSVHASPCAGEFWIAGVAPFPREVRARQAVYDAGTGGFVVGPTELVHADPTNTFNKSTTLVARSRTEPGRLLVSVGSSGADPGDPLRNGATFETRQTNGWTDDPTFAILGGADGAPRMTANADDYRIYAWLPNAGGVIQVAVSGDDGLSWSEPVNAVTASTDTLRRFYNEFIPGQFAVLNMIGIDADRRVWGDPPQPCNDTVYIIYAALRDSDNVDVMLVRGEGLGAGEYVWSEPIEVSTDAGWGCPHPVDQFFPALAVDPRGWLHVVYLQACDDPDVPNNEPATVDVVYALSTDGGQSWQHTKISPVPIDTTGGGESRNPGDYIGITAAGHFVYPAYFGHIAGDAPDDPLRVVIHRIRIVDPDTAPDLDSDGDVDIADFSTFLGCFGGDEGVACPCTAADFNDDGRVDIVDFATFASAYGGPGEGCAVSTRCER